MTVHQEDSGQTDRIAGVLLGAACGDALGVPYEFATPPGPDEAPEMIGGGLGPYAPGEYSDDTQMAVCIARVAASGADLREESALDAVATGFLEWLREGASDVGMQTRRVLEGALAAGSRPPALTMRTITATLHEKTGRTAGNGSLMRTGVVGLNHLADPVATAEAARAVSELTHFDPLAGDACVLWCEGVRQAVLDGTFDGVRAGLDLLPPERRDRWADWLTEAESRPPGDFIPNGFVVQALQAAWSSITHTPGTGTEHLVAALATAVRIGDDTDTVAAIAGALLGARWGASAIPAHWRRSVHGWPGLVAEDLIDLARRV
ncbi:ADP-ribosylglycohydrolase family protein [Actinomadura craniellae]|uniref:ADP-ribosylglycohydrolase family protein n=1 Tax=Actinomadura craniellae TaxID=2231787 RepID=A0A365HAH4_9ACTN|nr:ADP-ribosylglycohydrolase family protein [Actinomadura craniellae]RAY16095.1 ADP-ribosylglycohydrolase family protein [Actinomadura craniellae]